MDGHNGKGIFIHAEKYWFLTSGLSWDPPPGLHYEFLFEKIRDDAADACFAKTENQSEFNSWIFFLEEKPKYADCISNLDIIFSHKLTIRSC